MRNKPTYAELEKENTILREQLFNKKNREEFSDQIQQLSKFGSWRLSIDKFIITLSPNSNVMMDNAAKEISLPMSRFIATYTHPDDYELLREKTKVILQNQHNYNFSDSFIHKLITSNGDVKYLKVVYYIESENTINGISIDITDFKETELALQKSEAKVTSILHAMDDMVFILDKENRFKSFYAPEQKLYTSPKEFIGKTLAAVMPKDINTLMEKALKNVKLGKTESFEYSMIHPYKTVQWFATKLSPMIDNQEYSGLVAVVRNITVRKNTEQSLFESEKKFRDLFEKSGDANLILEHGVFVDCNQSALSMLNYKSKQELLNTHPSKIYPKNQPNGKKSFAMAEEMMKIAIKNGTHRFEWTHKKNNGKSFPCEVLLTSIYNETNKSIIHAVLTDISSRKKVETELLKAKEKAEEGDRLKSAFLANMSHEIRTPMNGIMGFTSLLKDPDSTHEEQLEYIDIIEKSGYRLLGIINDLIDISKIESGLMKVHTSEISVNEQMKFMFTFFNPEVITKKLSLKLHALPDDQIILTDHEKFLAILTNLIKNSIKYSNSGMIEYGYSIKDDHLEFFVKDQGIGIPQNKLESIFDRFVQADNSLASSFEGAGLGLSITKAFVELLGGKIGVKSDIDKGTEFYFTHPLKK